MIKKIILIVSVFLGVVASAQIPKNDIGENANVFPKEILTLSINSNVLLAGELLQYKAYNRDISNKISYLSKMAYVSLRTENDSIVFSHKLELTTGEANGDFFIPSNLKTGVYKLISYTNFSKNNKQEAFAQKDIYIINTFVKNEFNNKAKDSIVIKASSEEEFKTTVVSDNAQIIKTSLNKEKYGFREKVELTLESSPNASGSYAISVRKANPVNISGNVPKATKAISSDLYYVPELRGELISGIVLSKIDGRPVSNIEVSLTIPGKDFVFKIAKTNVKGRFFFSIAEAYNTGNSIIQLYGNEEARSDYNIVLDKKDFKLTKMSSFFLAIDPQLKEWLQERSIQLQIQNAYFDVKRDSILNDKINPAFYKELGTVFLLDDYTRFPTVRETFIEIITLAAIRGTAANSKFVVNNEYDPNGIAKFNDIDPLVIIDGVLIQNNMELINYNARDIMSIRVVNEPYRYGSKIFSGIIAIETKNGNFVPNLNNAYISEVSLPAVMKKKQNYNPDYLNNSSLLRIPDYRVQLLWETDSNFMYENNFLSFYTSDVSGVFEVSIEGFTNEGIYISEKKYFTVSKN